MKIKVWDRDGREIEKTLNPGAKLSSIVDLSRDAVLLNDQAVPAGRDPELRADDEIEYVRKSHKPGAVR